MAERLRFKNNDYKLVSERHMDAWWAVLPSPHITKINGSWDYLDSGDDEKDDLAMAFIERLNTEGR